jgi:5-methylcytosine-specific restriction endonuclease McrA
LFARDYHDYEGCWGAADDPYSGKREEGRDRWIRCYYCGEYVKVAGAVIAHKVAACIGGSDELENLALAHDACNNEEGRRYNQLPGGGYPAMMGRTESDEAQA